MLYVISITAVLFAAILGYMVYRSRGNDIVKMVALPIFLVLFFLMGYNYYIRLGSPIEGHPQTKFEYVHHVLRGQTVYLWIKTENGDRLHYFPYVKEEGQELKEAQEQTEQGVEVESDPQGSEQESADGGQFTFNFETKEGDQGDPRFKK